MAVMQITELDIGATVICDLCSTDFSSSDEKGGFLFGSKGVCPRCAPNFEAKVKAYKEEEYIRDRAREGETFTTSSFASAAATTLLR